jgi:antitoxin VapB
MALSIKNQETDRLAHDLAEATGETVTVAVTRAIQNRLDSLRPRARRARLLSDIREIQDLMKSLPDKDMRSADDLLGYDDFGLPR